MGTRDRTSRARAAARGAEVRWAGVGAGLLLAAMLASSAPVSAHPDCCSDAAKAPPDYRFGESGPSIVTVKEGSGPTIQQALNSVSSGGVVRVEIGTYSRERGTLVIRKSVTLEALSQGGSGRPIIPQCLRVEMSGRASENVTVRGLDFRAPPTQAEPCINVTNAGNSGQFRLADSRVTLINGNADVVRINGGTFTLERNILTGAGGAGVGIGIVKSAGVGNAIRYNMVAGNQVGIAVSSNGNVDAASNVLQRNAVGIDTAVEGGRFHSNMLAYNTIGIRAAYSGVDTERYSGTVAGLPKNFITENNIFGGYQNAMGIVVLTGISGFDSPSEPDSDSWMSRRRQPFRVHFIDSLMSTTIVNNCIYGQSVGLATSRDGTHMDSVPKKYAGHNVVYASGGWSKAKGREQDECKRREFNYGESVTAVLNNWGQ